MSSKQVIEIEDGNGVTLRVEFDGSDLVATLHSVPDDEIPSVDIGPDDRVALRDFLSQAHVPGRR